MIFEGSGPRWFSIDAHRPFLTDLASVLHATLVRDDPKGLSEAIVLVPTRRGARALAEAFIGAAGGKALLLPQILAIGDLEESEPPFEPGDLALDLPPAVSPMRRRFELARLVLDYRADFAPALEAQGALQLADALAGLLDSAAIEEATLPNNPAVLLNGEFAKHWEVSAAALRVATEYWPARLHELGLMDVAERRTVLLNTLAARWEDHAPERPVIAAGSTGSVPATARLLKAVADAQHGAVVLPGLDRDLANSAWLNVSDDHPQGALRRLLSFARIDRAAVRSWPSTESVAEAVRGRDRRRVVNEALRPAEATKDWRQQIEALRREARGGPDPIASGLDGLSLIEARAEDEAAAAIAVLMRETLQTPGATCALVTPDQSLARRVSDRLARWRIEADSSVGRPLAETPIGQLIALIARAVAEGFDPALLLALLKHPLVALAADQETASRFLERYGLRGPAPRGWPGLTNRLEQRRDRNSEADPTSFNNAIDLAEALRNVLAPLVQLFDGPALPSTGAEGLARAVEALAPNAWNGQVGEAASSLIAGLIENASVLKPLTARAFADLVRDLLGSQTIRPGGALHPRLSILGAIEARLVRADRLILAGLEEGVWPRLPPVDPFFSRPMRKTLGLPPPERRIGLSAHDFAQATCASEVVLITTERRGGQPAVRSRWLWRLETLARGAGVALSRRDDVLAWARALDAPLAQPPAALKPAKRPEPKPPLEARPRELPVTSIERWVRDPYAIYARNILGLRPLDPPDMPMDARARGTAIHAAFQAFAEAHSDGAPTEAAALFERRLVSELELAGVTGSAMARERVLARRLAGWASEFELKRRTPGRRFLIEQSGALEIPVGDQRFVVTAKADRIEIDDGRAHVLDFKTGAAPSKKQMEQGFSPQLTLTAAILVGGGFSAIGILEPGALVYVRATGRRMPGETFERIAPELSRTEADRALAGLIARVVRFDDPDQPYRSWTAPQFMGDRGLGDYDHLARVFEWHVTGAGEEGGE